MRRSALSLRDVPWLGRRFLRGTFARVVAGERLEAGTARGGKYSRLTSTYVLNATRLSRLTEFSISPVTSLTLSLIYPVVEYAEA